MLAPAPASPNISPDVTPSNSYKQYLATTHTRCHQDCTLVRYRINRPLEMCFLQSSQSDDESDHSPHVSWLSCARARCEADTADTSPGTRSDGWIAVSLRDLRHEEMLSRLGFPRLRTNNILLTRMHPISHATSRPCNRLVPSPLLTQPPWPGHWAVSGADVWIMATIECYNTRDSNL